MKLFHNNFPVVNFDTIAFDGTFNVLAINHILDLDNVYSFALKLNRESGFNIRVISEDTKITKNETLQDIMKHDYIIVTMIQNKDNWAFVSDYIRLKLICEYNVNNFIDLDIILNRELKQLEHLENYSCSTLNDSTWLMHNDLALEQYTKYFYRYRRGMITYDTIYEVEHKKEILDSHWFLTPSDKIDNKDYNRDFIIIVTDNYSQKLFNLNTKIHVKVINYDNFSSKDKMLSFFSTSDQLSNDYTNRLLNAKYIDINEDELIPEWRK